MKIRTNVLTLAAGAALALGALALPGSASALTWDKAITPSMSVTGAPQTADRTAEWTKQVTAMQQLVGVKTGGKAALGFFEEARNVGGASVSGEVAIR